MFLEGDEILDFQAELRFVKKLCDRKRWYEALSQEFIDIFNARISFSKLVLVNKILKGFEFHVNFTEPFLSNFLGFSIL